MEQAWCQVLHCHILRLGTARKPPVTVSAIRANEWKWRTVQTLRQASANRAPPSRLRRRSRPSQNEESALRCRLPPRCAGSQKKATQEHSRSEVNCCAIQHNARYTKLPQSLRCAALGGAIPYNGRYVLRPSTSARLCLCASMRRVLVSPTGSAPRRCTAALRR